MTNKLPEIQTKAWEPCLADPFHGIAFFDGIRIDTDKLTDPRWNRVFPILEEEQIVMCRSMAARGIFAPGRKVLDVGTGSGILSIYAAAHGCNVQAIDHCPRAIRTAEHNLRHPCNVVKIKESVGKVKMQPPISLNEFASIDDNRARFEVILLNPPFNPTTPGLPAASHAEAGPEGNKCLIDQLPEAIRLLSPGGVIVGVQMFMHEVREGENWWERTMSKAADEADILPGQMSMVYAPIVEAVSCDARKFLLAQYEHFLNPHLYLFPDAVEIQRYIDRYAPEGAEREISYIYYEIRLESNGPERPRSPKIALIPQIFELGKTWMRDRLVLHRAIVEHTSLNHSVPVPALFLENDFTPALPTPVAHGEAQAHSRRELYEQSPLSAALRWIVQSRMLTQDIGFEKILIDVGPWFDSWEGRKALHQEGLVCMGSRNSPDAASATTAQLSLDHQANVRSLQECKLPPLLHPELSGLTSPDEWRPAFFQELAGEKRPPSFSPEDAQVVDALMQEVRSKFARAPGQTPPKSAAEVNISDFHGVAATFSTCSLPDLGVPNFAEFESRVLDRCKLKNFCNLTRADKARLRKDMELLQWVFHRRIREVFKCENAAVTVLMAIPISSTLAAQTTSQNKLPATFRGVIWIFAKLSSHFGPLQESLFSDLGRICWMLENESIAQEANKSLGTTLARQYQGTFAHEIKDVVNAISSSSPRDILSSIREYFRMLCLTPRDFDRWTPIVIWERILSVFPEGFAQGASTKKFIENHFEIAKMVYLLPDRAAGKSIRTPSNLVIGFTDSPISSEFCAQDLSPSAELQKVCCFSMALVSSLLNALKNVDSSDPITISMNSETVSIRNPLPANEKSSNDDNDRAAMDTVGGTDSVLRGHIFQYGEDTDGRYWFDPDPENLGQWLTRLPLPTEFIV